MYIYLSRTAFVIEMPTCASVLSEEDGRVVCRDRAGNVIAIFPQAAVVMHSETPVPGVEEPEDRPPRREP